MDHQGGALGQGHHYENLVLKKLLTSWQLVNIKCRPLGLRVSTPICAHVVISCSQMIARQAGRTGCTSDLEEIKEVLTWIDCSPWSVGALGSKKMVWKGDYGLFLPLCKNCMVKLIKSLPEYNVYNSEKEKESLQSVESNIEWAKGQGKIKAPDQASYEKLKVVSDQNNRQDGAIIAGMLRQQLMKMVSNARETYEEEALEKAKAKKAKAEEDKTAAELAEQLQSTMLEDADKANEARTIDCEM